MLDILIDQAGKHRSAVNRNRDRERADKPVKSLLKAISWRILGTLDTIIISYLITGKAAAALSIGSIEVLSKTVLYYFHERLWAYFHSVRLKYLKRKYGRIFNLNRNSQASQKQIGRRIA